MRAATGAALSLCFLAACRQLSGFDDLVFDITDGGAASSGTGAGAASSTSSGPGGGGSGPCMPGAVLSCYDGPPGTEGISACKAGTRTCDPSGASFGPCEGQVVPAAEKCDTPVDESCDMLTGCSGAPDIWSRAWPGNAMGTGVAVTPAGHGLVIGTFSGSVDFGGGALTSNGNDDVFVVELDSDGKHVHSTHFGGADIERGYALATTAKGDIVIAGDFSGEIDLGSGMPHPTAGGFDAFVAKLDATAQYVWASYVSGGGNQSAYGVAVDAEENVIVVGSFENTVDFGGGARTSQGAGDLFVVEYDAAGTYRWDRVFGGPTAQDAFGVQADAAGNVLVTGFLTGSVDFGQGPTSGMGSDLFVLKLTPTGDVAWAKRFDSGGFEEGDAVAVDRTTGAVIVTGSVSASIDFGGGVHTVNDGLVHSFIAKLDASGQHLYSAVFVGSADGTAVSVDGAGYIVGAGTFTQTASFGGPSHTAPSAMQDLYVAKWDAAGGFVWSVAAGSVGGYMKAAATDLGGNVWITGQQGGANFGSGPLMAGGFVTKLPP